jgi:hypothetical protein
VSESKFPNGNQVSRRSFLGTAAAGGGALLGIGLIAARPAAAAGKLPQSAAKYQPTPKGKAQCDNCSLWQPRSACKLVEGTISPQGWCVLYQLKR